MREIDPPAEILNIVVAGELVTFTTDEGVIRKYTADGKKQRVDLLTAKVETVTKWDQTALTQEMAAGPMKIRRTWQPTTEGEHLVVTVTTESEGGPDGQKRTASRRLVYERSR